MAYKASKYISLTLLPVLALGAPRGGSSTTTQAAQGTLTVSGGTSGSSSSHLPTSVAESASSNAPKSTTSNGSGTQPTQNPCGQWVVPGTGVFANKSVFTFVGNSLPESLSASSYEVDDQSGGAPYNHIFDSSNVAVSGGYLNLKVPGGQEPNDNTAISSAEVTTNTKILYGSVRTNAIFSTVPGTCQATFFYKSDRQEIDIEYLSSSTSTSNPGINQAPWLQYTNQATKAGGQPTYRPGPAPANVATLHEYRVDWIPGKTMFFLDGVLQQTFSTNVPTQAGPWVWNNYSNGDRHWTVGPPMTDNVYKIQNITMYYNLPGQSC